MRSTLPQRGQTRVRSALPQRGQALLEVLVSLLAMVPLLLALVWLGKMLALRQATIEASRLLAFECTVRLAACADATGQARLADEVRRRAFSRVDAPIRSREVLADEPVRAERNPLWVDAGGRPLLSRMSDVAIKVAPQRFDAGLAVATARVGNGQSSTGAFGDALNLLSHLAGPGRFGLGLTEGLYVATVAVQSAPIAGVRMPLPGLAIQARTALLADAWNASGPQGPAATSVQSRVAAGAAIHPLYEASIDARYLPVRGFLSLMGAVGLEPLAGAFRYHEYGVDVVPPDRIGGRP